MTDASGTAPRAILVAVNDLFFYTKIRDVLLPAGYVLERVRAQEELAAKLPDAHPVAVVINMNDERVDALRALETLRKDPLSRGLPILAFANHEEIDTWRRAKELGVTKIVSRNEFSARTRDLFEEILNSGSQRITPSEEEGPRLSSACS